MHLNNDALHFDELQKFAANFFKVDPELILAQTTAADIENWDSLNHMTFIASVEAHFKVEFEFGEILAFENLGSLFNAILTKKRKQ